jgi:hypothetical protein
MMERETIKSMARSNSRMLLWTVTLSVFALASSVAFALDPMGPPAATLRQGQCRAGIDYSRSTMNLELNEGEWVEYLDGVLDAFGDAESFTLKNVKTKRAYANFGYGATDNIEIFLRLGGASAKFGDSIWEDSEQFDSNTDFAVGAGIKVTFQENDRVKLGGLLQANWAQLDGNLDAPHWEAADSVEFDVTEVQIALGPTYKLADPVLLYGGPFFHFVNGDLDDRFSETTEAGELLSSHYHWHVDESSVFGAYFGAQLDIGENTSVNVEFQHTADADAIGIGLLWKF